MDAINLFILGCLGVFGRISEEQQRHVRENTSEEELVVFDILTRPTVELTTEEKSEIKKSRP